MRASKLIWIVSAILACTGAASSQSAITSGEQAFERLKSLAGDWVGPAVWERDGQRETVQFEISYRVTAAGSVVLETLFPDTPGEMVSVYYLEGDALTLIHFCTAGNQPRMRLWPLEQSDELRFRCTGGTNMTEADFHMHSFRMQVLDEEHIQAEWSATEDRKVQWIAEAELQRKD